MSGHDSDSPRSAFRLGDWLVEPSLNRVSREGEVIRLEPKVIEVLVCLAGAAGEPVAKQQIIDTVWRTEFITENTLTRAIADLRKILGDDARQPRYIETISKRGYRIVADVEFLDTAGGPTRPAPELPGVVLKLATPDHEYILHEGDNIIGRAPEVEIVLDAGRVSRRHACIRVEGETAVLEDLGSKNGTFLRGKRLTGAAELEHGDEIRIGRELGAFRFVVDDGRTLTELSRDDDS